MGIYFHPHALQRMAERGASEAEVIAVILEGEQFQAKFGRTGFRRNFLFDGNWRGKRYSNKQIEAFAVKENDDWWVVTVIVRFF